MSLKRVCLIAASVLLPPGLILLALHGLGWVHLALDRATLDVILYSYAGWLAALAALAQFSGLFRQPQPIDNPGIYSQVSKEFWRGLRPRMSTEALQRATEEYLRCLVDRHRYLSLKGMGVTDRIALRLPLLDLYVPLKARRELPEGETWKRLRLAGRELVDEEGEALAGHLGEPQPVLDLLREGDGLIILGDPGAGKTTFLKYLALRLALGQGKEIGLGKRLPLLLPLAAYANVLSESNVRLDAFIATYLHGLGSDLPISEMLGEALREGAALILLDGLDEVKDLALRHTVVERVVDFYTQHRRAGNKFVLSSRIVGYRAVRPTAVGLTECTLVDFEDEEIHEFVTRWTAALERQAQGDTTGAQVDAQREKTELLASIKRNPGVRRLAANPLLLTILALMKRQGIVLPDRRVELYDQYVRTLLSTWNRARSLSGRATAEELDLLPTTRILAQLALWMHEVSPGVGLVKREHLRRQLEAIYAQRGQEDPEVAAQGFLEDVRESAGLLLERGAGQYGFIHLTFEEYLAAVAIAQKGQRDVGPIVEALADHVGDAAWREVSLLTVAYLGIIQQRDEAAGAVVEALVEESPGSPGLAAVLAGEAVADAWPAGVPQHSKDRIIEALIPTMQDKQVPARLRREAGLLLGRLGWLPDDLHAFLPVPAGTFLYGDDWAEREISYPYWIGKYPVTNAQYARFIGDRGYDREELWSKAGWAWRRGADSDLKLLKDDSLRSFYQSLFDLRPVGRRDRPFRWDNPSWNNRLVPVVGIIWFEAEAYCRWLNDSLASLSLVGKGASPAPQDYSVRLPTEVEWERAARGTDGRKYPWGEAFDPALANTEESIAERGHVLGGTAVCTYPNRASPVGTWDMSGNVWEWTLSRWSPDEPYRVVRGGSFMRDRGYARCASRLWSLPDLGLFRLDFIGFRAVVSLAISED